MIGQRLEIRQGQGLVITPQLQQAIKLLQLSNLELDEFVEGELERNPLLQRDDGPEGGEPAGERSEDRVAESSLSDGEVELGDGGADQAERAMDSGHDIHADAAPGDRMAEAGEAQPGLSDWSALGRGGGLPDDLGDDRADTREKSLWDHLHDQASAAGFSTIERGIALALIDQVDEGGRDRRSPRHDRGAGRGRAGRLPRLRADRRHGSLRAGMPQAAADRAQSF